MIKKDIKPKIKSSNKLVRGLEMVFDFMASLKLAVITIVALAIISAVGTIYESNYDRVYAQKLVYHSKWMWMIMATLAVNITAVMVDRWPWKRHHISFILAHVGILLLLAGSVVTFFTGLDGSMVFEIGGNNRYIQLQGDELAIYSSLDGKKYRTLYQKQFDFFNRNFEKNPISIELPDVVDDGNSKVLINGYINFGLPEQKIVKSKEATGNFAIQFLIEGSRANQSAWLFKDKSKMFDNFQLGPASVTLANYEYERVDENEIIFKNKNSDLLYEIYKKGQAQPTASGVYKKGEVISTGWMDFKVRVLNFYPEAEEDLKFVKQEKPSGQTTSALLLEYKGKKYQLGHNRPLKIFGSDKVHVLTYSSVRYDVGFDMKVVDFQVGRYQGTSRAKTYESTVKVEGEVEPVVISMNEPMKKAGLTFYQSSFQEDETGRPTHSVLSVNKDPGRFLKYLGSLLIFLGIFMLFYFKDIYAEKYKKRFVSKGDSI